MTTATYHVTGMTAVLDDETVREAIDEAGYALATGNS